MCAWKLITAAITSFWLSYTYAVSCPEGWIIHTNYCYYLRQTANRSEGENKCSLMESQLLNVSSWKEKKWVRENLLENIDSAWMDGSASVEGECIAMHLIDGARFLYHCKVAMVSICEKNASRNDTGNGNGTCPDGWKYRPNTGTCYLVVGQANWSEAQTRCSNIHGKLIMGSKTDERRWITSLLKYRFGAVWIENHGPNSCGTDWKYNKGSCYHLGGLANRSAAQKYCTNHSSHLLFVSTAAEKKWLKRNVLAARWSSWTGRTADRLDENKCKAFWSKKKRWFLTECNETMQFVCKKEIRTTSIKATTQITSSPGQNSEATNEATTTDRKTEATKQIIQTIAPMVEASPLATKTTEQNAEASILATKTTEQTAEASTLVTQTTKQTVEASTLATQTTEQTAEAPQVTYGPHAEDYYTSLRDDINLRKVVPPKLCYIVIKNGKYSLICE